MFIQNDDTGVFPNIWKLLGKVVDNFAVVGYETNLIVNANIELRILGAAEIRGMRIECLNYSDKSLCIGLGKHLV